MTSSQSVYYKQLALDRSSRLILLHRVLERIDIENPFEQIYDELVAGTHKPFEDGKYIAWRKECEGETEWQIETHTCLKCGCGRSRYHGDIQVGK